MYRREQVQEWIQWSRESLPETGDYPLLDVAKIKGTTCPWQEKIDSDFRYFDDKGSREKLLTLFENHLSRDPADVSSRFTALNLHYVLSTHANDDSDMKSYYDQTGMDHEEVREDFARKLAYLVRLLPVENCTDCRTIRWEICNACAIRDWGRATQLLDRLEALDCLEPAERQILRGQFNFFVVFGSKTRGNLDPWFWEPKLYDSKPDDSLGWERISHEFILFIWGLNLGRKLEEDKKQITLDEAERDRISDAANDFHKGLSKRPDLSPAYRSMLAGCYFAKGDFWNAAKNYERVLEDSNPTKFGTEFIKIATYKCIAASYHLAGETEKAEDPLKRCADEFPSAKGIYKELARIQAQAADFRSAYESLTKESERDPAFGENWLVSTSLALGSVGHNSEQLDTLAERGLNSNPQLSEGLRSLVNAHWPSVDDLTPDARRKWIYGSYLILGPQVDLLMHQSHAEAVAIHFGTAVELELKSQVFVKFREHLSRSHDLHSLVGKERSWGKEKFCQFLVNRKPMTLGEMHHVLKDCGNPKRELWIIFKRWVQENRRPLLNNLWMLKRILDIHNGAKHPGSILIEKAESMPGLCRDFLSKLTPRPHPARSPGLGNPRPDSGHDRSGGPSAGHR